MEDFSELKGGGGGGWGGIGSTRRRRYRQREINRDEFRKDRVDRFFCSSSLNLLHDLNSSICNE